MSFTPRSTLTVTDNRTGATYELPIFSNEVVNALDFRKIITGPSDAGLKIYDVGYQNTASCSSAITFIDGDQGILRYRGYDIEELVDHSSFLEVAYLLIFGELPDQDTLTSWESKVMNHTYIHENLTQLMKSFRYDSHPMGMLISLIGALSTFYPEANTALQHPHLYMDDSKVLNKQIFRILGKVPTMAACAYRHRIGRPYNTPQHGLGYTENFLYMMDRLSEVDYKPHPTLSRVLDKLFIIHADHELNCSTATMRQIGSTLVDPYTAVAGAAGALFGPRHGGANEAVLRMLSSIGTVDKVPQFLQAVKDKKQLLMGFGHRVYKSYDPRAKVLKDLSREIFDLVGENPLLTLAQELERQALADSYFVERKLFPNVDFYSGLIYQAMGFPTDMFPVLFCIPRTAGWLAHWTEMLKDSETKIYRPRQLYIGHDRRPYTPIRERGESSSSTPSGSDRGMGCYSTGGSSIRRMISLRPSADQE